MTSTVLDLTAMDGALKELYDSQEVAMIVYEDNPSLALIPKKTNFVGRNYPVPLVYGVAGGRSATFSNAQANIAAPLVDQFLVTRVKDYGIARIDNETMLASATDSGAFLEAARLNIDGKLKDVGNSLASALHRSGTGSVGKISSISTGVITLSDAESVTQFEVNQVLNANSSDGGSPRAAKGYVIAVDRSAGTVTVASSGLGGSAATPSGWTTNDFILVDGDNNAKISGFEAWIPASAPSSTTFFGVDRTADVTRLGGVRYDGSALPLEEAFLTIVNRLNREGGKPTAAFCSYATYLALEKSLGTKVEYETLKAADVDIGFEGIRVTGTKGPVTIIPDRNCPGLTAKVLSMKNWCLHSLGEAPRLLNDMDGLDVLRVTDADQGEVRVGYYAQAWTNAPGYSGHLTTGA